VLRRRATLLCRPARGGRPASAEPDPLLFGIQARDGDGAVRIPQRDSCSTVQNAIFAHSSSKTVGAMDRACDYLDDDIASGYVRVLQELIAASWARRCCRPSGSQPRSCHGSISSSAQRRKAERELGGLGPLTPRDRSLRRQRVQSARSLYLLGLEKRFASPPGLRRSATSFAAP